MKRRCASAAHLSSAAYVTRCDLQTAPTQPIFILQGVCDTPVPPDALVDHSTREPVMYKRILTAALLFGMACTGPPVFAQALACAPRAALAAQLEASYGETLSARGLQNPNALIEVFASAESGSFTVLISRADGMSCILSTGTHWMVEPVAPPKEGAAS